MRLTMTLAAVLMTALAAGCQGDRMASFDVVVDGSRLGGSTVPVHLVGVSDFDRAAWEAEGSASYWRENNDLRKTAEISRPAYLYPMSFGEGHPRQQKLDASAPIWDTWDARNARWLFVVAYLPDRAALDRAAGRDPFRQIIPLQAERWKGVEAVRIRLHPNRVELETQPLPPK